MNPVVTSIQIQVETKYTRFWTLKPAIALSYSWSFAHDLPIKLRIGISGIQPERFYTSWLNPITKAGQVFLLNGFNNFLPLGFILNLPLKYKTVKTIPGTASAQTV